MAEEQAGGGEVAQRVFDALEALKGIADPTDRAREISSFLRESGKKIKELSDLRREYVKDQRSQKVPYRTIAKNLGVHPSTVQDIERDYSGSGKTRPRKDVKDGDGGSGGNE
ncbi:hypothetical protein [Streptomyces sp. NPDC058891]|uniref:hypothetical protein n=1 Tax=Streptomyces sp. NPDC058891 TaxID=3346667 RepID=UPI0036A5D20B